MSQPVIKRLEQNLTGRDFVVGDIHGCFSALEHALANVAFDPFKDRLIAVGDLVDRGPESERVAEFLEYPWFFSVRGNHEQMLIDQSPHNRYTIESDGSGWFYAMNARQQLFHQQLFGRLPLVIELKTQQGAIGILHADVPVNDWSLIEQSLADPRKKKLVLWSRTRFDLGCGDQVLNIDFVVVGHTPQKQIPALVANVVNVDGGFYSDPRLLRVFEVSDFYKMINSDNETNIK